MQQTTPVHIIGRSSSHFTRVVRIFAHELDIPYELTPIHSMRKTESSNYGDNPALKMPTLRTAEGLLFGTENICRKLAEIAGAFERIVWPENLRENISRNAQELVWHGMGAQVQIILGTMVGKLPADNIYFVKAHEGFLGALGWLNENLEPVLRTLPDSRQLSLFEVTLFCLMEHILFQPTVPVDSFRNLQAFTHAWGSRAAAQKTLYHVDPRPA